jgi:hypothetical protein
MKIFIILVVVLCSLLISGKVYPKDKNGSIEDTYNSYLISSENRKIDSIILSSNRLGSTRYTFTYNTSGDMSSQLIENLVGGDLVNYWEYFYSYDDASNVVSLLGNEWLDGEGYGSWSDELMVIMPV